MNCKSSYLESSLIQSYVEVVIETMLKIVKEQKLEFDSIAFTGISGILIAPIVAYELNKELICVRKYGSRRHSPYLTEGNAACKRFVIIDDCICSGDTIDKIHSGVLDFTEHKAKCVAAILYNTGVKYNGDACVQSGKHSFPGYSFYLNKYTGKLSSYLGQPINEPISSPTPEAPKLVMIKERVSSRTKPNPYKSFSFDNYFPKEENNYMEFIMEDAARDLTFDKY